MAWSPIPTLADGNLLSAAHLNTLSNNQEYLYSLSNAANAPFNSWAAETSDVDNGDAEWVIRHRLPYYHYRIVVEDGSNIDYIRVFYNGVKIAATEGPTGVFAGYYDLTSWAGLPNLVGAWALATGYDDDANGDGEVVTHGGEYYRCIDLHTSSATDEPGVGANWTDYWELLTLPGIGTMCRVWVTLLRTAPAAKVTVQWLFETDSTTL